MIFNCLKLNFEVLFSQKPIFASDWVGIIVANKGVLNFVITVKSEVMSDKSYVGDE